MPGASSTVSGGSSGGGTKRRASEPVACSAASSAMMAGGAGLTNTSSRGLANESRTGSPNGPPPGLSGGDQEGGRGGPDSKSAVAVMKMKAEVFETDRENFLCRFAKPTQIYRFLRARMVQKPLFLQRNLSYMKSRMSRSHKSREGFKVDSLLARRENVGADHKNGRLLPRPRGGSLASYSSRPIKFYNVFVLGVADGQLWLPEATARLDVCIARTCAKRRKDGLGSVSKVFEETIDFKMFSPSISASCNEISIPLPSKCPVVSIPIELCCLGTNGHTVQSYSLVIRLTIPRASLQQRKKSEQQASNHLNSRNNNNNYSSDNLDEPKAKRRRSAPATKDRENFIYDGDAGTKMGGTMTGDELVIYTGQVQLYDKDIPGDKIREADFDLQLGRTSRGGKGISFQRIRREVSWGNFNEKHSKLQEQQKPAGKCAKVSVALRATSEQLPRFMEPPPPLLCAALKKEVGAGNDSYSFSLAKHEAQKSVRIIYQFLYGSNSQQQTESRDDLRCPWCSINCIRLYSLLKHLKICHPRFVFSFSPIPNGTKIDVTLNDSYDGSYSGSAFDLVSQPPGEAFARNGPTKRTEVFSILVCRPKQCKQSLQEFYDCDEKDVDQRRTYITGHNRLYHHTSTCLPIHPREIDVDSEGEPDPEWLRVKTTMMIDEFTDVNEGEKELMKLWNLHVMRYNYVGDCQIPLACKCFVELHAKELVQKNLYRNFCLHLTNLFDFGLLTQQGVHSTIQILHAQMKESKSAPAHLTLNWKSGQTSSYVKSVVNGVESTPNKSFTISTTPPTISSTNLSNAKTGSWSSTITATATTSTATASSSTTFASVIGGAGDSSTVSSKHASTGTANSSSSRRSEGKQVKGGSTPPRCAFILGTTRSRNKN